jgi:SAM-dependent methyltransferase
MSSLKWLLQPSYLDEARKIVQQPMFDEVQRQHPLKGHCLNAGCGEGLYANYLASLEAVTTIVHIDMSPAGWVKALSSPRHRPLRGSLTRLPFESQVFDSCMCSEVIEHIPDDRVAVAELARVLKPGGRLLLSVPTPPAPFDAAHVREGYTLDQLEALLRGQGLEVLHHAFGFRAPLRLLTRAWSWQFHHLGRDKRSFFPRFALRSVALLDRTFSLGRAWDLAVLAQRV